jgi:hypothetical protein
LSQQAFGFTDPSFQGGVGFLKLSDAIALGTVLRQQAIVFHLKLLELLAAAEHAAAARAHCQAE